MKRIIIALLKLEARIVLRKYKPHIVAITGSVGKTSTKDAIYTVLSPEAYTRKSDKSFNGDIGIPLTILGVPNAWRNPLRWLQNLFDGLYQIFFSTRYPAWLVLEIGADRPGDISSLEPWLATDIAVITRLPEVPVHVEFFPSIEAVVEEKASLIDTVRPGGTLIAYADDERIGFLIERAISRGIAHQTFGFSKDADVYADSFSLLFDNEGHHWPIGMRARVTSKGEGEAELKLYGTIGLHGFLTALAAIAVARVQHIPLTSAVERLEAHVSPLGRMHLLRGIKNTLIIDDTYNSSPAAVTAALDTFAFVLSGMPSRTQGRSVAVLGDMLELGRHSVNEHRKVGAYAAKTATLLITIGFRARDIAQGALDAGMPDSAILQYDDVQQAAAELKNILQEGDCVLVKGSQSMRMERLVEEIMENPEDASKLLVRQDEEWKKR